MEINRIGQYQQAVQIQAKLVFTDVPVRVKVPAVFIQDSPAVQRVNISRAPMIDRIVECKPAVPFRLHIGPLCQESGKLAAR